MINERKKYIFSLIIIIIVQVVLFFVFIGVGRVKLSFTEITDVIFTRDKTTVAYNVVVNLRLYRIFVSMFVGASLSVSGAIYQSIFNNKLVSPDILGVSSGASVGACFAILLSLSSMMINFYAFVIGLVSVSICLLMSYKMNVGSRVMLILLGLAVSGFMSSIVGFLKFIADNDSKLSEMTFWLLGDLSKVGRNEFIVMLLTFFICFFIAYILSWRLDIISLGKKESLILGNNYNIYLVIYIIIATILTSTSVAICGIISWVGLIVPNVTRLIAKNSNREILPLVALSGALFLSVSDTFARTISPSEIPLSVITGIIGAPIFILILNKRKKYIE